jgi:ribonucleoside-diphosphate reductase alpha chain
VLDHAKLQKTITTAMRMLDNVIDINYYAVEKARTSNTRHRPVGLGMMAFQDSLYEMRIPYASDAAVEFADLSMEAICYYAYWASTDLAKERGQYTSFKGSLWDQGILPIDTLDMLAKERGGYVEVDRSATLDWDALRKKIASDGMRNSNCTAIAPTAPFPTSSAWMPLSSPALEICPSSPTSRVSSPSSTASWSATSSAWVFGMM